MEGYVITIGITILIYMLMAGGLALQYGFTGLSNFGLVGFVAIGAYTSSILAIKGVPIPLSLIAATGLATLCAYPIGIIALRLGGNYLAIVTLGFSEAVRMTLQTEEWLTRGMHGLTKIPRLFSGWVEPSRIDLCILLLLLAINIIAFLAFRKLVKSPFGRAIEAIRDNETAARALGKDTAQFKTRSLMLGAACAGLAGGLQAHYLTFISPEQYVPLVTFYVWTALVLGGADTMKGVIVGTCILVGFLEGSRFIGDFVGGISEVKLASVRIWMIGMALICVVLYRPQGLFGRSIVRN